MLYPRRSLSKKVRLLQLTAFSILSFLLFINTVSYSTDDAKNRSMEGFFIPGINAQENEDIDVVKDETSTDSVKEGEEETNDNNDISDSNDNSDISDSNDNSDISDSNDNNDISDSNDNSDISDDDQSTTETSLPKESDDEEQCRSGFYFVSDTRICVPENEKDCDDGEDNDIDGKIDLLDDDCNNAKQIMDLDSKSKDTVDNLEEFEVIESLFREYENDDGSGYTIRSYDISKNEDSSETTSSRDILDDYNSERIFGDLMMNISSDSLENSSNTDDDLEVLDGVQLDTKMPTNDTFDLINGTMKNDSSWLKNSSQLNLSNSFGLECDPIHLSMLPGTTESMDCLVDNTSNFTTSLSLECNELLENGIDCHINGFPSQQEILVKEESEVKFSIDFASVSTPLPPPGVYAFTISILCNDKVVNPTSGDVNMNKC